MKFEIEELWRGSGDNVAGTVYRIKYSKEMKFQILQNLLQFDENSLT